MASRQRNTDQPFPLGLAFEFLEAHGYQAEVEAIRSRGEATQSGAPRMRRAEVLVSLDEAGLTDEFNRQYWPRGFTEAGQKHLALLRRSAPHGAGAALGGLQHGNGKQDTRDLAEFPRLIIMRGFFKLADNFMEQIKANPSAESARWLKWIGEVGRKVCSDDPADFDSACADVSQAASWMFELFYCEFRNPMFVSAAWSIANYLQADPPIPDWIREYHCKCAHQLLALQDDPPIRSAPAVSAATGFSREGTGRGSMLGDFARLVKELKLAQSIDESVRGGESLNKATEAPPESSPRQAQRTYRQYQALIRRLEARIPQHPCPWL
jgi:hypothetical protein